MVSSLALVGLLCSLHLGGGQASSVSQRALADADSCEGESSLALLQRGAAAREAQPLETRPAAPARSAETAAAAAPTWPWASHPLARLAKAAENALVPAPNCTATPALCSDLLRCASEPVTSEEIVRMYKQMATEDGHANLRTWCLDTLGFFANSVVQHCLVDHDLKTAAQLTYESQVRLGAGEADGSYCFSQGYCSDTLVSYDTTLDEAEAICDQRYPGWRSFGLRELLSGLLNPQVLPGLVVEVGLLHGGLPPATARLFAMSGCAMGNYHCDVMYCRDTYCKMDYYISKYGHLQP